MVGVALEEAVETWDQAMYVVDSTCAGFVQFLAESRVATAMKPSVALQNVHNHHQHSMLLLQCCPHVHTIKDMLADTAKNSSEMI